ncbi:peptidoglycan recognition protein family protein [Nitriliruptor alkaliphilus]|uniref:peptidoglycan recognition protein family protein n=1 Tax=Nitriliruptor alkaliphilus TaxID=427918 RepID=UPI0006988831|nr:peptidoglycan recognition family protein [Nitriliruptor alkaliphilus]
MNRRQLLRAGAVSAAGLLAGCRGDSHGDAEVGEGGAGRTDGAGADAPTSPTAPPSADGLAAEPTTEPTSEPEPVEPQAPTPVRIEVLCRDALGLAPAVAGGVAHRLERVTLHHTGVELGDNARTPTQLRRHQRLHQGHGWSDIAYHYGVDLAGNVYELRRPDVAGDTFTDYDPTGHLLLLCEGNYDLDVPTDPQLSSLAALMAHAWHAYGVHPGTLTGHRDHVATRCPGDNLYVRLPELAAEARRLAELAPYELDERCDEDARRRVAAIEAGS